MDQQKNTKKSFFLKIFALIVWLAIFAIGFFYWRFYQKNNVVYTTILVKRDTIQQTVSETGTVEAPKEINLSFPRAGKINKINVKIGDVVSKDQNLAELDYSELLISQKEVTANLNAVQASLKKILSGASKEDINIAEANIVKAQSSYEAAQKDLANTKKSVQENIAQTQKTVTDLESTALDTTYESSVNAAASNLKSVQDTYSQALLNRKKELFNELNLEINNVTTALDAVDRVLTDSDAGPVLSVENISYLNDTTTGYNQSLSFLSQVKSNTAVLSEQSSQSALDGAASAIFLLLNTTLNALNFCFSALENTITTSSFTQSELDTFKSNIVSQQSIINAGKKTFEAARSNLTDSALAYSTKMAEAQNNLNQAQSSLAGALLKAKDGFASAQITGDAQISASQSAASIALESLRVAQADLAKLKARARSEDIDLARAQVNQALSALDKINKQVQDSKIFSPIDGVVSRVNYESGEQSSPNQPIFVILEMGSLRLESLISENDITKVKLGDEIRVTLDALGEYQILNAKVTVVDPDATVVDGVIYYNSKAEFENLGDQIKKQIKPGMTANLEILTAKKDNALIIPSRAIIEKGDGSRIVQILNNGVVSEKIIKTGLRGDDGTVEVLDGLSENEVIVISTQQ